MSNKILCAPNILTISRLFFAPLIAWFILSGNNYWALVTYFIALATDGLDGYLARKNNELTKLGFYLEAVADNVLIASVVIPLTVVGIYSQFVFWGWLLIFGVVVLSTILSANKQGFTKSFAAAGMKMICGPTIIIAAVWGILNWPYVTIVGVAGIIIIFTVSLRFLLTAIKIRYSADERSGAKT